MEPQSSRKSPPRYDVRSDIPLEGVNPVPAASHAYLSSKEDQSVLYTTMDLMERMKDLPSDISGCDIADMLLPTPDGRSTKERLTSDSSFLSDVPKISDISRLLEAGLSHEELVTVLLDGRKSSHNLSSSSVSLPKLHDEKSNISRQSKDSSISSDFPNISDISRLLEAGLSQESLVSTLLEQASNFKKPAEKRANINNTFDESFAPMSHSIIDRDEQSILRKYHVGNDVTIQGIESSNISWRLDPRDITLFKDTISTAPHNVEMIGENDGKKEQASNFKKPAEKRANMSNTFDESFAPMSYSIIDRDEKSILRKYHVGNDVTIQGIESSNISWRLDPRDITLFKDAISTAPHNLEVIGENDGKKEQASNFKKPAEKRANMSNTFDESFAPMSHSIIDRDEQSIWRKYHVGNDVTIKGIESSNISWRLDPRDVTLFKDTISTAPHNVDLIGEKDGKKGTSQYQVRNNQKPEGKKVNLTTTFDESFIPLSHSVIDRDEESILKKYHIGNDITIQGIEKSNISWQLNPSDISLFKEISQTNNHHPI